MGWNYSDWMTQDGTRAQRARLAMHVQEVADKLAAPRSAANAAASWQLADLNAYLSSLREELRRLDAALAAASGAGVGRLWGGKL